MKKILITGENSYIGTSFDAFMKQYQDYYIVDTISVRDDEWKQKDFSLYDAIYHVAGIAHRKETKENESLYYDINFKLTKEIAGKAKTEGVSQFIFLSTISVYGKIIGVIDEETEVRPINHYGESKLLAEQVLKSMETTDFKVAIVRPPMVYGENSKGNYSKLKKMVLKVPIFPNVSNNRSMIYITNLSIFIKLLIDRELSGIYLPQNCEYVRTKDLVRLIRACHRKKILLLPFYYKENSKVFNALALKKMLGSLTISKKYTLDNLNEEDVKYIQTEYINFEQSIRETEQGKIYV